MFSADIVFPASAAAPAIFRLPVPVPTAPKIKKVKAAPKPSNPFLQLALCLSLAPFLFFFAGHALLYVFSGNLTAHSLESLLLPGGLLTVAVAFSSWVWRGR